MRPDSLYSRTTNLQQRSDRLKLNNKIKKQDRLKTVRRTELFMKDKFNTVIGNWDLDQGKRKQVTRVRSEPAPSPHQELEL